MTLKVPRPPCLRVEVQGGVRDRVGVGCCGRAGRGGDWVADYLAHQDVASSAPASDSGLGASPAADVWFSPRHRCDSTCRTPSDLRRVHDHAESQASAMMQESARGLRYQV